MEEIGIPELTSEQLERLCEIADDTARGFILSRISQKGFELEATIDVVGSKPIEVRIDLEVDLSPLIKDYDARKLVDEATAQVFIAIERYLSGLQCKPEK